MHGALLERSRRGFTLVELLAVMAIIALLLALLLPAVSAARDAARRTLCKSNLRQWAVGIANHEDALGHYPSNGWGTGWAPHPSRGSGPSQPGSWVYQTLPYVEQNELALLGSGGDDAEVRRSNHARLQVPLPILNCPSRRNAGLRPVLQSNAFLRTPKLCDSLERSARLDYAINGGGSFYHLSSGPLSLAAGDDGSFVWPDWRLSTGIAHARSRISSRHLRDGLSKTYLAGENSCRATTTRPATLGATTKGRTSRKSTTTSAGGRFPARCCRPCRTTTSATPQTTFT
jgi:prepilin-type N-terminal cleavage/methylation domain-containing protein